MQVKISHPKPSEAVIYIISKTDELELIKQHTLGHFQSQLKIPGFRAGKVPLNLVEKHVDQQQLQSEFLEEAINQLYPQAITSERLRPVANPEISIKKFVPFSTLEFEAKVTILGEIKLADYKKVKKAPPVVSVSVADVDNVLESLQTRMAEKKDVDRAAKDGDQVWIDFSGTDTKGKPVPGADGKDYPLMLGSNTFIPGFEENLIGIKSGAEKTFTLAFPKDYGAKSLAGSKVAFTVKATKVQEVVKPKLDDAMAAKVGPFSSLKELKADIKKQLQQEREEQANLDYESELVRDITARSTLVVPNVLTDEQVDRMLSDLKQNLTYRGQTYQEFLEAEGKTEEQYQKQVLRPRAEERVKASLVLAEIADQEKIDVTPEELDIRMQLLKGQHQDEQMRAELEKPTARREIASRMLTEKTLERLKTYVQK